MAAFGVLRVLTLSGKAEGPRLGWTEGSGGFYPVVYTTNEVTRGDFVRLLAEEVAKTPSCKALTWTEQIKSVRPKEFSETLTRLANDSATGDHSAIDWLAALAAESANAGETLEPTPFDMSVARQKFPADAIRLAVALASTERGRRQKTAEQEFEEALFGPWRYEDDQHSFGWDPSTIKLGAFSYKAPTAMQNKGVRAAVWLAFESLPLFPVFTKGKHQNTRAFLQDGRHPIFYWPIWRPPITLSELQSLLASAALIQGDPAGRHALASRGLIAIYRSLKFKPNKYMVTFRPAELAYSVRG
jgi:hypothetical protein